MNDQLAIDFTAPMYRNTDPATSRAGAVLALETAATLRDRCLAALRVAGPDGLDDFALAAIVGRQQTSAGKRRLELLRAGLAAPKIIHDPQLGRWVQATSIAPSGARTLVWVAAEYAGIDPCQRVL